MVFRLRLGICNFFTVMVISPSLVNLIELPIRLTKICRMRLISDTIWNFSSTDSKTTLILLFLMADWILNTSIIS